MGIEKSYPDGPSEPRFPIGERFGSLDPRMFMARGAPALSSTPEPGQIFTFQGTDYEIAKVGMANVGGNGLMVIYIRRKSGPGYRRIPARDLTRLPARKEAWALNVAKPLDSYDLIDTLPTR